MASSGHMAILVSLLLLLTSIALQTLRWIWTFTTPLKNIPNAPSLAAEETSSKRISSPLANIKSSYDVVVIGSGYGGGVAASRLARAQPNQSVCVLESGRERWPGRSCFHSGGYLFPVLAALAELRVTGLRFGSWIAWPLSFGRADGLYHWVCGKRSSVLMAHGLGGTSLINANVFMKPDPRVFQSSQWPEELRQAGALDMYFERVESVLQPETIPKHFPQPRKYTILKQQASAIGLGGSCTPIRQTVAFHDKTNTAGVRLSANKLRGRDSLGLDDGSKNTVLATYLADAWNHGAELYCGCNVRFIRPHPAGGYLVFFWDTTSTLALGRLERNLRWVHAKKLAFLAAGSIGSTEIVLRSQHEGLSTSSRVGKGLSGNGGILSFGYDLDVDNIGHSSTTKSEPGTTITGMVDCRGNSDMEQDFVLQDGSFNMMSVLFRVTKPFVHKIPPRRSWFGLGVKRLFRLFNPLTEALQDSQVYLTLGHDNACGSLILENDLPVLDMRGVERESSAQRIKNILIRMTHALDGSYLQSTTKVTAHPLGGLEFAGDGTGRTGSVSHTGELFLGSGAQVHHGLHVVDGSVISRSLGANPLATITAIAERSVDVVMRQRSLSLDLTSTPILHPQKASCILNFSERMIGKIMIDDRSVPVTLYAEVQIPRRTGKGIFCGRLSGTLDCPRLSSEQMVIEKGVLTLFEQDLSEACQRVMRYRFTAVTSSGTTFLVTGKKLINPSVTCSPFRLWQATTTLLLEVKVKDGPVLGSGQLKLSLRDFVDQLRTLRISGSSLQDRRGLFVDFFWFFTCQLMRRFLSPVAPAEYPGEAPVTSHSDPKDGQKTSPKTEVKLTASDGVHSTLRMWDPKMSQEEERHPAIDVLFIPGASVSHWIFASPYIKQNAIEHFTNKGYRCWCLTTRFGKQSADDDGTTNASTSYDARLDIAAALKEINRHHAERSSHHHAPYVVAHCVGSLSLSSALLDGTIQRTSISGITASQIFLHPVLQPLNGLKARSSLTKLYHLLAGGWFPLDITRAQSSNSIVQSTLDTLLRFYPVTSAREICNSTVCNRCLLPFGRLWNHQNLNKATHDNLHRIFGGVSIRCVEHLAKSGKQQAVLDGDSRSMLTENNLQRLAGIPVLLVSGAENNVYSSRSTLKTLPVLGARGESVRRKVFPDVGHLCGWMGERGAAPGGMYETVEAEVRMVMGSLGKAGTLQNGF
ncbi:hypothetical protein Q7P37_007826 [Cladosporium fusiforme]